MSQPMAVLGRIEEEVSALLVAGLATQRGGRERLEDLAAQASTIKMERLSQELRSLALGQDPVALASGAFTCLVMARKFKERLAPWPPVAVEDTVLLSTGLPVRVIAPGNRASNQDKEMLSYWMESGDALLRAYAAEHMVLMGDGAVPELARLAARSTTTVRREAIRALGQIGGEEALDSLLGLPDPGPCLREILLAVLPHDKKALPGLTAIIDQKPERKNQDRRRMSAALLYRSGAWNILERHIRAEDDAIVLGFSLAAALRAKGNMGKSSGGDLSFTTKAIAAVARAEESGDEIPALLETLENGAVNDARLVSRWGLTGSPLESVVAQHFMLQTGGGTAKSRQRATSILCGLAYPPLVPAVASQVKNGEMEAALAANILGETGGGQAVGMLLDMLLQWNAGQQHIDALKALGDPGAAPTIVRAMDLLYRPGASRPFWFHTGYFEELLASLGDGAAAYLGSEMRARQGTPAGESIQRALLQMKGPHARKALEGIDTGSIGSLVSRLGQPNVSQDAVKALIKKGDAAVEPLVAVLQNNNLSACKDALAALDGIGTEVALKAVYEVVELQLSSLGSAQTTDDRVCAQGIEILAKRKNIDALALFAKALVSRSYRVAGIAAEAMIKAGEVAVPHAMPLLDSSNAVARAQALNIAAKFRVAAAEEKAIVLLGDKDHSVQTAAYFLLGELGAAGSQRAAQALGEALASGGMVDPRIGIHALAKTGQRAVIPYLRSFAESHKYHRPQIDQAIKKIESASPAPTGLAGKLKSLFGGR